MSHHYSEHGHGNHRSNGFNGYYGHQGHNEHNKWLIILERIRDNPKLKSLVIIAGIAILLIVILLIVLLFPLVIKLFNFIMQNGLQGIWDSITGFADKLLKGTK